MSILPAGISATLPAFAQSTLPRLLKHGANGFAAARGYHIYTELRLTKKAEVAETDSQALKFARAIDELVNHAVSASSLFNVVLLEAQGAVLHFFREGPLDARNLKACLQFVSVFTSVVYDDLQDELGDDWQGFASCLDHGDAIIVAHKNVSSDSAVSLGPCANRPAKQLFYGPTPAGHLDIPGSFAPLLGQQCDTRWWSLNLRDRSRIPFSTENENAELNRQFKETVRAFRNDTSRRRIESIGALDNRVLFTGGYRIDSPKKLRVSGVRCDLDGFSAMVEAAFAAGPNAVHRAALGFAAILDFGDYMQRNTPGAISLPWAGDCATTLLPDNPATVKGSLPAWLEFSMRWQSFGRNTPGALPDEWARELAKLSWAVGGVHGQTGFTIVLPIVAQGRQFLVGAGWPVAVSLDAQNEGQGGDIVTHRHDYNLLDSATQRLFRQIGGKEFWKTRSITKEKLREAAIEAAESVKPSAADYLARAETISIPSPRPHLR